MYVLQWIEGVFQLWKQYYSPYRIDKKKRTSIFMIIDLKRTFVVVFLEFYIGIVQTERVLIYESRICKGLDKRTKYSTSGGVDG